MNLLALDSGTVTAVRQDGFGRYLVTWSHEGIPPRGGEHPVMCWGGGSTRESVMPPEVGAEAIIGELYDGRRFILGCVQNATGNSSGATRPVGSAAFNATQAAVQAAGGGFVAVSAAGIVLVQPGNGQHVLMVLSGSAQMQISRGGQASDAAVLARPLVDIINDLKGEIDGLRQEVFVLRNAVFIGSSPTPPIPLTPTRFEDLASDVLRLDPARAP